VKHRYFLLKGSLTATFLTGLLLAPSISNSQSLDDAIRSAMVQYPTIIAAQARLLASQSDITRAQSQHYPQLNWRGTSNNYSGVNNNGGAVASGVFPDNTWIQSPNVTLNIWAGGKIQADVDQSTANSTARFYQQRLTRDEVALLALESYLSWARSLELVSLARSNVLFHKEILDDVKKITQLDQGRMIDQDQATVRLENALITLKQRETDWAVSEQRLARMLQGPVPVVPTGITNIRGTVPVSSEAALAYINDLHPAIAVQHARINAARATLSSARSEFSPTVNLSYGKQTTQGTGQGDYITQLTVNVPIFTGGSTYGAVGSASSLLLAAQQGLTETRLLLTERVLSIWPELKASNSRKALALRQSQTGQEIVNGFVLQFRVGRRSLLDLLTVQSELFAYQTRAVIATFDEHLAKGRLLAAIGQLAMAYQGSDEPTLAIQSTVTSRQLSQAEISSSGTVSTTASTSEPFGYKSKSSSLTVAPQ
jgi:adhesin transport system outer membrane protein